MPVDLTKEECQVLLAVLRASAIPGQLLDVAVAIKGKLSKAAEGNAKAKEQGNGTTDAPRRAAAVLPPR